MKRRFLFGVLGIFAMLLLVISGCSAGAGKGDKTAQGSGGEGVILFGAALPLTGDLAPQGKDQKDGYEIWKKLTNDKGGINVGGKKYKVDVKYYDYASDTNTAVKLAEKLIVEDKVKFLLGPYGSASIMAVAPIAEKYGVIHMAPTGASEQIFSKGFKYTFGTLPPTRQFGIAWMNVMLKQNPKPKTIAILSRNDLFPADMGKWVKDAAEKDGIQVVYFEQYPVGTKDFLNPLSQVKSKNPDLFFFTGYANDAMQAVRQAKQIGLKVKGFGATAGLTTPDFREGMKDLANDVTSVESWFPGLPDALKDDVFGTPAQYAETYSKMFGYEPPYTAASSSVSGYILAKSIEKAGSLDPAKVREEVAKFEGNTFYGPIKLNSGGQLDRPAYALQIEYPKLIGVSEGAKTGDLIYPMR